MFKDYRLILDTADGSAYRDARHRRPQAQVSAAELARQSAAGSDEDFSSVVRTMERISK